MDGSFKSEESIKEISNEKSCQVEDLIVIGGGPAGLAAALYAGRALLSPLVLTGQMMGGQTATIDLMENYPGFSEGVNGMELLQQMQMQAEKFNARIVFEEVSSVDLSANPFKLTTMGGQVLTRSLITATGASPVHLGVPGSEELIGRGVSFCATCDGFFFRDKHVLVVGGGDSAVDEGIYLTRFVKSVTIIHRRDQLRATRINQERAFANPKIKFEWDSVVKKVLGDEKVTGALVRNVKTGEERVIPADGIFVFIGLHPNSELFCEQLELDEQGYIITDKRQRTSVPGVFAAGDVQDPHFRQVIIAAGSGAVSAMEAERFLSKSQ